MERFVELDKALFNERREPAFSLTSVLLACHHNLTIYKVQAYAAAAYLLRVGRGAVRWSWTRRVILKSSFQKVLFLQS